MSMNRPETQNQPSVDELLLSIRQAIHGDNSLGNTTTSGKNTQPLEKQMAIPTRANGINASNRPTVSASMSQTRVSLQPNNSAGAENRAERHTENFFKLRNQLQAMGADSPHKPTNDHDGNSRSSGANGFAGILNGDTRLEEALAKLKRAGLDDPGAVSEIRDTSENLPEADFGDYQEDFELEEYEDEHQYPPETEPVEDSFSVLTRQSYIQPAPPRIEPDENQYESTAVPKAPPALVTQPAEAGENQALTSDQSAAETSAAFNRLADTIIGSATSGERSIDDITRELLRPMLQSWLDEHLPRVVERLVREEIERVARWGGN